MCDRLFWLHQVYQEIEPLVTSCIDGYHVCIFAYGQTGSGKTYTMEVRPLVARAIAQRCRLSILGLFCFFFRAVRRTQASTNEP